MHILSITARNYRIHKEVTVELDRYRTLIDGPNESGKSTLVEAAHRALFLKSKLTGEAQKSMTSDHGGHPEVEVRFQTQEKIYQISKHFSGANGTSTLTQEGGKTWQGDEAESRLAELLRVEAVSGGRGIADRSSLLWAHLWVWQGKGGEDPTTHATLQKDSLLDRLKKDGGVAAIESQLDSIVANRFVDLDKTIFTKAGKPKADSELFVAAQANENAQTEFVRAQESVERLLQSISSYATAERTIAEKNVELKAFAEELAKVLKKLEEANELRQKLQIDQRDVDQARKDQDAFVKADAEIRALAKKIQRQTKALEPKDAETKRLDDGVKARKKRLDEADKTRSELEKTIRRHRARTELARAWLYCFEQEAEHVKLKARASDVAKLRKTLEKLESELAKLPSIDARKLKSLQSQAGALSEAEAALKAMAAGIEVVVSEAQILVDGEALSIGQTRVIDEDTEVEIGDLAKLKITPGGGTSLSEARNKVGDCHRKLTDSMDATGVGTMDEAAVSLDKRHKVEADIQEAKTELKAKDSDNIDQDLAQAKATLEASRAEVERRKSKTVDVPKPDNVKDAKPALKIAEQELSELEIRESKISAERDAATIGHEKSVQELAEHLRSIETAKTELHTLKIKFEAREESDGSESSRKESLSKHAEARREAEKKLSTSDKALKKLQPESLEGDKERLERAINEARNNLNQAEQDRAVARSNLTSDGNSDPEETLAFAKAKAESAGQRFADVERKARAIRLLMELFTGEQRDLSHQFTQPLAEKITGYLQQLFGTDARADVDLTDGQFEKLVLSRPSGTFEFDSLSGGAREQVAAAFRLAMAEILAEDHDGCLPVVFDDAFTNSDPERIQTLQRMLDLAARRGLQIILLTCDPRDYGSLGAKTVAL
ncbi:MAG: AAA family ATPase [Verrucomicrobia bacterium]|nr:AAA family ATPase [Verrucomicrobiota bacterium]